MNRAVVAFLACAFALGLCSPAEAAITRSGTLQAIVTDDFRDGESTTRYSLRSGEGGTPVRPTVLAAEPGDRVVVTGEMRDGRLTGQVEATAPSTQPAGDAQALTPPRKVAVLLVTFPGDPAEPWSPGETRSKVFTAANSANAFFAEESYGDISLTGKLDADGDVFGWLELDTSTANCPYNAWKTEADAAAAAEGINLTGYEHIVYVFPQRSSCSWLGLAVVGGDWSMINGNLGVHPISHELGHNLGLEHAGSWTCTSDGVKVQISDTCTITEYGDPFDTMGNIAARHSNGWNLDKLGILVPENVETVDTSGTYSLRSALNPTTQTTVLRIPRTGSLDSGNVSSWYYLEVRQTGGVFENVTDASTTGVSIRATRSLAPETLLLDSNPATTTFADAPLGVGQAFRGDTVEITTEAAGAGNATVSVELDEEPPTAPTGLTATASPSGGLLLRWNASTDDFGVDRYLVFRDGADIGSPGGTQHEESLSAEGQRFAAAGAHTYVVYARDAAGNVSPPSNPVTASLPEMSGPICMDTTCTVVFRHTGAPETWTVPPGVSVADFTVEGAQGGGAPNSSTIFNRGGRVAAKIGSLAVGEEVGLSVGGEGESGAEGGEGGFGGGGDGVLGGGGGGYSSVERSTLVLLAGGGGGWGLNGFNAIAGEERNGGSGGRGGQSGTSGSGGAATSAHGATLGGGAGGSSGGFGASGGSGGGVAGASACAGGATAGGSGAAGSSFTGGGGAPNAGGGGGGGYVGGGQGGRGARDECGNAAGSGGGGGGSSFAANGLSATFTPGIRRGYGRVSLAYANPIGADDHSYTTAPDQELVVPVAEGVLADATGPTGVPLSADVASPPAHGSLTLDDDGSFTYAPAPGYFGADSFDFRVADPSGNYATGQVTLAVALPPSATIFAPPGDGTYEIGQSVSTAFSCNEGTGGPGLSACDDSTGTKTVGGGIGSLDTSTVGTHTYTVTAESRDGLTGSTSIAYMVAPEPQSPDPQDPPEDPGDPPSDSEEPPSRVGLSLGVERRSLRTLLRTGKLMVAARVDRAAELTLIGKARIRVGAGRTARTKLVAVFERKTVDLPEWARTKVALALSPRGRRALRDRHEATLVIAAMAENAAGEPTRRLVALTLR